MSHADVPTAGSTNAPPLSWPPPGMERLQGRLWRIIGLSWVGSLILIMPLLWELAIERPFWSLGPFEGEWQVGMVIAGLGFAVMLAAFSALFQLMRQGGDAAEAGFGTLTIVEVMTDVGRDMGFLIQGRRHFGLMDPDRRAAVVMARLRGAALVLAAALWLAVGFGIAVLLAARGFLTPPGILLLTLGPVALLLPSGLAVLLVQNVRVRSARAAWIEREGSDRISAEGRQWAQRLDEADGAVVLGAGASGDAASFRSGATLVLVLVALTLVPAATVAATAAIGPILAEIAVPTVLSVQEMAGAAEPLRRYRLVTDESLTPGLAGSALQNVAFVGGGELEPWERAPETRYEEPWFPDPDFPDAFSETVARDLMSRPIGELPAAQQAALRGAAAHPAHAEFVTLSRAGLVDVVSGRWSLPFPDTLSFQALPWPRFQAFRTAGLALVARAAVDVAEGRPAEAEAALAELVSTGLLLVDQGPTLIDNLVGVVLTNMGGDALEEFYLRVGRTADAQALRWARDGARDAARKARAGVISEDIHSLLQGIPDLVEDGQALRGLRWEYFATFNTLAPCINVHKMVFGPDETYDAWRQRARDALVRVRGEVDLFELAEGSAFGRGDPERLNGFLPRFLGLTLGNRGSPGSCASLIDQLEAGGGP